MTGTVTAVRAPGHGTGDRTAQRPEPDRLAEATDPRTMAPRLASALGVPATACHLLDVKYQPGLGATLLYRLGDRLLRGDLVTSPDGGLGTVVEPGVSVHAFPHDPDLPTLPQVVHPGRVGPLLAQALSVTGDDGPSAARTARRCRTTLLRYRPGKRATVRVDLPQGGGSYVAKVYHDPAKAAAVAAESGALARTNDAAASLRLAPTAAHLAALSVVVQRTVAGSPLTALVDTPRGPTASAVEAVRRAARALAELHDARPGTLRERPVERELHRFRQRAERIRDVAPQPGDALAGLADRLLDHSQRLPAAELGTVHGDCKPSQFLLGERHVYLLDVDHLGVSDLAADVGTFLASLQQAAVRHGLSARARSTPGAYGALADAFLDAYLEARDGVPDLARIRWQEAVALERKALRAFARAPCSPLVAALTTEAHRRLDG